ncbi:M4 family metallopeptidase [Stigmatella erecta]|uniref:Neutral metalloproteinase n=1 Tax=Stigmatella erecta TaxID=83460 RepID=A0A1I0HXW1_9BACT|nr:M4 family metallopeptidase [Stigmatella erecta]SET88225.1 thermolysin Metallo peptidase. MEROPS family M04 [Stigmatella erecta]
MSIRRLDGQTPAASASRTAPTPAAAPAPANTLKTPVASARPGASDQSSFTPARRAPTELTGASARETPIPGPVAVNSREGQAAVQSTLNFISQQKSPPGASLIGPRFDASQSFTPRAIERDELGMTHVRMDRVHEGVKVFGEQVIGHLDADGKFAGLTGETSSLPTGLGTTQPKLTGKDALAIAQKQFGGQTDRAPQVERVLYQDAKGEYQSAYRVELANLGGNEQPRRMNYLLDANSGKLFESFNQLGGIERPKPQAGTSTPKTEKPLPPAPPASGTVDDTTLYSGQVDLATKKNADGTYSLEDSTRGKGVVTLDAQGKEEAKNPVAIQDNNNVWGEATDPSRNKAAVDAHYGAQMTYDMLKNVLGRDSLDGKGEKLISNIHIGKDFVNAYWDGTQMNYGDGDGKDAGPLTTLDIAGHEIAHGLTERTAGLLYRNESGGLNEAFSDIMGSGVEWYASQQNKAVQFDWAVGEDAWTPNNGDATDALRYMDDPTKDGYSVDHYKNYPKQTEVHGSSGIANNAFYLLANGGTNRTSKATVQDGIGMEKGLKIYYRALAHYMTPNTTFAQAREATVKAATDLYGAGSTEAKKVAESWAAVGVGK